MIIHLIGSMRHFDEDFIAIRTIADVVLSKSNTIALNWFDAVKSRKDRQSTQESELDWPHLVSENINAIKIADALIVEGSRFNYSQAFQTAIALSENKPVLNLYREDFPEFIEWPDRLFVSGIDNSCFHSVPYQSTNDLPAIVEKFLDDITPKTVKIEASMALELDMVHKLKSKADHENKTINGVIKDIVLHNI